MSKATSATETNTPNPGLDLGSVLADRDVGTLVCCGSGGVGKTTLSAALAVRAADHGRRVVVLTIDPARRLAQSLGITELDNTPRPVAGIDAAAGGSLDAMMLDMKRTFDEVVEDHAGPERAEQFLQNPFYQALSTSFSGTQEYMAMEKLGQLRAQTDADGRPRWDLIVVDTPPSRSALDFLDAPEHLSRLLDGRLLKLLLAPAKGPMRVLSAGMALVSAAMGRVLGSQLLADMQTFISAFEALFGGFRQRAEATLAALASERTRFVVVATPEPDALRESGFFVDRLSAEGMPLAGVAVNRVHASRVDLSPERAEELAAELRDSADPRQSLAAAALGVEATRLRQIARERQLLAEFARRHPTLALIEIPAQPTPVTDLSSLRDVADQFGS